MLALLTIKRLENGSNSSPTGNLDYAGEEEARYLVEELVIQNGKK